MVKFSLPSSLTTIASSGHQVMDDVVFLHSEDNIMPVPKRIVNVNTEIMGLQAAYDILKDGLSSKDRITLETSFNLWKAKHQHYVKTPTVKRSLNPAKILAYMWSKAERRRQTFSLMQLAASTKQIYLQTSTSVRAGDSTSNVRETPGTALEKDPDVDSAVHRDGRRVSTSRPHNRNGDQQNGYVDNVSNPTNATSDEVPPLVESHVSAMIVPNRSNENELSSSASRCAVCHTRRDRTNLCELRDYYVCTTVVQPSCAEIVTTVDKVVEECVLGFNKGAGDIPTDSQYYDYGEFFDQFRVILATDHHDYAADFVQSYKNDKEFAQLSLDTIQEILDTKLSSNPDWKKPNIIRTRLCRLLGNFARECDHISFPSSLAVSVEPVTRPPPTAGGFAIVSFGHLLPDKITMVAIKTQKNRSPDENDHNRNYSKRFLYELMMWRNMSHRCIAKFIGFATDGITHALVIQYFQNGSLEGHLPDYLNKTSIETIRIDCRRWILDVAEGLLYLHLQGYAHGDIHGGNILLDENLHAVISDFGTAVYHDAPWYSNGSVEGRGGRRHFLAPELLPELDNPYDLKDKRPTKAGDVFSFGSVSSQMHNGSHAYNFPDKENPANIIFVKIEHIRKFWEDGRSIQKPHFKSTVEYMEDGLWNILSSCFHFHPQDRPGIEDIFRQLVSYFGIHECGCGIQSCDRGDRSSLLLFND